MGNVFFILLSHAYHKYAGMKNRIPYLDQNSRSSFDIIILELVYYGNVRLHFCRCL